MFIAVLCHMTFNAAETIVLWSLPDPTDAQLLEIYGWTIGLMWLVGSVTLRWAAKESTSFAS